MKHAGIIGGDLEVTEKVLTSKRIIFELVNSDSLNTTCWNKARLRNISAFIIFKDTWRERERESERKGKVLEKPEIYGVFFPKFSFLFLQSTEYFPKSLVNYEDVF